VSWDLRGPSPEPVDLDPPGFRAPWGDPPKGPLMAPGRYTATLMIVSASGARAVGTPQTFEVKPVRNLPADTDLTAVAAFQQQLAELRRRAAGAAEEVGRARDRLRRMRASLLAAPRADPALFARVDAAEKTLAELRRRLEGDPVRDRLNEADVPSIAGRVSSALAVFDTRQAPTATQRRDVEIATSELGALSRDLEALIGGELAALGTALEAAGAPWIPRR
jgi:hypothetical protein